MRRYVGLVVALVVCLVLMGVAPAFATYLPNPQTGKNMVAWPKPDCQWFVHLSNPDDPQMEGTAQLLETNCHEGIAFKLMSPSVAAIADHAVITVDGHEITLAGYQLGFCFVLEAWPDPWPFGPVYADPEETLPLFVYFGSDMTSEDFLAALKAGGPTVEIFDAENHLLLEGTVR